MALWKICGRAGSGKTTWLRRRIGQAMQQGQPSYSDRTGPIHAAR